MFFAASPSMLRISTARLSRIVFLLSLRRSLNKLVVGGGVGVWLEQNIRGVFGFPVAVSLDLLREAQMSESCRRVGWDSSGRSGVARYRQNDMRMCLWYISSVLWN